MLYFNIYTYIFLIRNTLNFRVFYTKSGPDSFSSFTTKGHAFLFSDWRAVDSGSMSLCMSLYHTRGIVLT